ncbi:P-loop containing nucleoside triphosphate hydrolase [Phytophthora cactorum]|nr:P-loop containing nucleoside triphosphate hydrolase [Phytophthora cactorum]
MTAATRAKATESERRLPKNMSFSTEMAKIDIEVAYSTENARVYDRYDHRRGDLVGCGGRSVIVWSVNSTVRELDLACYSPHVEDVAMHEWFRGVENVLKSLVISLPDLRRGSSGYCGEYWRRSYELSWWNAHIRHDKTVHFTVFTAPYDSSNTSLAIAVRVHQSARLVDKVIRGLGRSCLQSAVQTMCPRILAVGWSSDGFVQGILCVDVVNTPNDETPAYSGLQHSFGRNADTGTDKVHRRSLIQHNQEENDTKPQDNKEFEFVSPRTNAKAGPRYDAIAVLVVMSFKVLVAPIILVAICLNSPYLQSPPHDGKPAYGSLRTNTFEDYNETLSAAALALIDELESANAVCGDGTSDWDDSLTFISAEPQLIVKAVSVLKLPVSNDMIAEVTAAVTSACNSRWTIEARLKTFMFQPIPHINEFSSILAADLTIFPESMACRTEVAFDTDMVLTRAFVSEGLDQTRNAPTTLRLFPYNFPCVINTVGRSVAPVGDAESTAVIVQPMLRGYYGGCFVHLVNTSGIYIGDSCEISSLWIDYGLMLQAPDDIPLCSTEGVCVHNYYNSQWEWASTKDGVNIVMSHNTIRSRYADKVEMSILPGIVIMQILLMSMLSMYQVMSQKQSVLLSQIWAYRCQNGRMQAMYLLQIAYHLYRESDTYYLALGTGTMSVECVWNLTFCVMAFSYSFVNIVKSRTGEQQLDRHFRLSWEMPQLHLRDQLQNAAPVYPVGAEVCKLTDSCVVFSVNIAVVIAAFAMLVWGATASVAYVLRTRHNPHPVKDLMSWFISWKVAFQVTLRPPPKTKAKALSHGASIVNLADATSFECYCIGEHFRFMFNDCEDISHVKKNNLRVPTAEAVLLSGFVYRGKYLYRADDIILLLFTRCRLVSMPALEDAAAPRVELDGGAARPPRYGIPPPDGAMAFATGTASRPSSLLSSRGGSRGSTSTEIESRSSFLIAAVAENRAREIGIGSVRSTWWHPTSCCYGHLWKSSLSKRPSLAKSTKKSLSASLGRVAELYHFARKYFNQTKGAEDIKRVMANNVDINIGRNYVAMASVACVMKYIEYIQGVYIAEKSMKFSRIQRSSQARQEVVGVFLDNPAWFFDVMEELRDFVDLDRLLLSRMPSLRDEQFRGIKADIERVVNDRVKVCRSAAQKRIQECFAVRAGVDGMLDVARRTYLDTIEKIHEVVHTYKENLGIPIRLNYTPLVSLNVRLNEALTAVYKLSNDVIQQLLDKIRPRASTMHAMVESIALLDMLLRHTADCHRAWQHDHKKGRHPLVERVLKDRAYIPSDTFFDPLSTFHIVTGPNCAGKSTYLRATALITIMAQMGCYVPASEASIPIRDRICTRFGTSDDMEENASSFAVEMTETAFILETCTSKSLVLIDELGRGTANDEGAAIAWSIGEEMIHRGSHTCFATHYHQLNRLAQLYPRCRCYHMGTGSNTNSVHFRYVLKDGPFPSIGMYGIKTAALSGLPAEVIREAERTYEKLRGDREAVETR